MVHWSSSRAVDSRRADNSDLDGFRMFGGVVEHDLIDIPVERAVWERSDLINAFDVVIGLFWQWRLAVAFVLHVVPAKDPGAADMDPIPGTGAGVARNQAISNGSRSSKVVRGVRSV